MTARLGVLLGKQSRHCDHAFVAGHGSLDHIRKGRHNAFVELKARHFSQGPGEDIVGFLAHDAFFKETFEAAGALKRFHLQPEFRRSILRLSTGQHSSVAVFSG